MACYAISDAQRVGLKKGSTIALDYEAGATNNVQANTRAIIAYMDTIKDGAAETKQPSSPATSNSSAKGGTNKANQLAAPKNWTDSLGDVWHKESGTFTSNTYLHLRYGAKPYSSTLMYAGPGLVIKYDAWSSHDGFVYLRQPRGNGQYAYVAVRNAYTHEAYGTFK